MKTKMSKYDEMLCFAKRKGLNLVEEMTLESLRRTWFELGYRNGHPDGSKGIELTNQQIEARYGKLKSTQVKGVKGNDHRKNHPEAV